MKVCILAAGIGQRMNEFTENTNKVLLPIQSEAIISKIISLFKNGTEFVVALGYESQKIRDYCELAHPDTQIQFVDVDVHKGPGSGPARSLYCCKKYLDQPFFVVCGDTLWDPKWTPNESEQDWLGVCEVPKEEMQNYCLIESSNGKVTQIIDKQKFETEKPMAFTGLFHINDPSVFFEGLESEKEVRGERQLSNGFKKLLENDQLFIKEMPSWINVGDKYKYEAANKNCLNHTFSKKNEFFYNIDKTVIKYNSDPIITKQKVFRAKQLTGVVPKVIKSKDNFFSYQWVQGETFDINPEPPIFLELMNWLDKKLWSIEEKDDPSFKENCQLFYKGKTLQRIDMYKKRINLLTSPTRINGQQTPNLHDIISLLDWSFINRSIKSTFHGDLITNNILVTKDSFQLIDWRHGFAGSLSFGDLRYDLAKLLLSFSYDILKIKTEGCLSFKKQNQINFSLPTPEHGANNIAVLKEYCSEREILWTDIEKIRDLILINIAPLHKNNLAEIFWSEGLLRISSHQSHASPSISRQESVKER